MGNHRFRLANMMPNAWFYKFKEMNKSIKPSSNTTRAHPNPTSPTPRSKNHTHHNSLPNQITPSRASYYFPSNSPIHPKALDTNFTPESPRKSSKKPRRKPISPRLIISTTTTTTNCSSSRNSTSDSDCSAVLHCTSKITSSANDIIFDMGDPEMELPPPIVTKKKNKKKKEQLQQKKRRSGNCGGNAANSPARLLTSRASSPWLVVAKKVRAVQRANLLQHKSLSESMVVVKNSSDPRKDFRDSMMEMVRENNLRASKDLEELLACYLSLNSDEHHDVIVKAFEEIWFDVSKNVCG